jgi:flagellar assembly protein FliH
MTGFAVPKEQQTAYERWEMSSFSNGEIAVPKPKKKPEDDALSQKIAKIFESVRQEAYTKGMQEGFAVGMAKAKEFVQEDSKGLVGLLGQFSASLEKADESVAEDLLALALDIAKAMIKTKLEVDPAVVLPVVRDAIHYLPSVQSPARIIVHPEDAHMLREYLQEEISSQHWQIQEDSNIERGGCMVETGANQIDASNAVRWKRISEALAQENDWLR